MFVIYVFIYTGIPLKQNIKYLEQQNQMVPVHLNIEVPLEKGEILIPRDILVIIQVIQIVLISFIQRQMNK